MVSSDDSSSPVARRTLLDVHPKFRITADEVSLPGEQTPRLHLVVEPRRAAIGGVTGVAVVPVSDGRVALLRIYRHAVGCESWEIPRGFVDDDAPAVAAARELEEETLVAFYRLRAQQMLV